MRAIMTNLLRMEKAEDDFTERSPVVFLLDTSILLAQRKAGHLASLNLAEATEGTSSSRISWISWMMKIW